MPPSGGAILPTPLTTIPINCPLAEHLTSFALWRARMRRGIPHSRIICGSVSVAGGMHWIKCNVAVAVDRNIRSLRAFRQRWSKGLWQNMRNALWKAPSVCAKKTASSWNHSKNKTVGCAVKSKRCLSSIYRARASWWCLASLCIGDCPRFAITMLSTSSPIAILMAHAKPLPIWTTIAMSAFSCKNATICKQPLCSTKEALTACLPLMNSSPSLAIIAIAFRSAIKRAMIWAMPT